LKTVTITGGVALLFVPKTIWFSGFVSAWLPAQRFQLALNIFRAFLFEGRVLWILPKLVNWLPLP
jgi:hypothetical protein